MGKTLKILLVTLVAFGFYYVLKESFFGKIYQYLLHFIGLKSPAYRSSYPVIGLPIFIGTLLIHDLRRLFLVPWFSLPAIFTKVRIPLDQS